MEYLIRFVMRLCDGEKEDELLEDGKRRLLTRLIAALTLKRVHMDNGDIIPKQVSDPIQLDPIS